MTLWHPGYGSGIPLLKYEFPSAHHKNANHSLETGDAKLPLTICGS